MKIGKEIKDENDKNDNKIQMKNQNFDEVPDDIEDVVVLDV